MKRVKRDMTHRAYKQGYNQGVKGHTKRCPFSESDKRGQWLGGWRDGHADYVAGYRTVADV
ncbi:MAG: ribosome modulation factor [Candidatus Berkiella sp.]